MIFVLEFREFSENGKYGDDIVQKNCENCKLLVIICQICQQKVGKFSFDSSPAFPEGSTGLIDIAQVLMAEHAITGEGSRDLTSGEGTTLSLV